MPLHTSGPTVLRPLLALGLAVVWSGIAMIACSQSSNPPSAQKHDGASRQVAPAPSLTPTAAGGAVESGGSVGTACGFNCPPDVDVLLEEASKKYTECLCAPDVCMTACARMECIIDGGPWDPRDDDACNTCVMGEK